MIKLNPGDLLFSSVGDIGFKDEWAILILEDYGNNSYLTTAYYYWTNDKEMAVDGRYDETQVGRDIIEMSLEDIVSNHFNYIDNIF